MLSNSSLSKLTLAAPAGAPPPSARKLPQPSSIVRQALERIVAQEIQRIKIFSGHKPGLKPTLMRSIPTKAVKLKDGWRRRFHGRLEVKHGVVERSLLPSCRITDRVVMSKMGLDRPDFRSVSFQFEPKSLKQTATLPLGARITVNAWNQISLIKSKLLRLITAKDKMPFEVTPLIPHLTWV